MRLVLNTKNDFVVTSDKLLLSTAAHQAIRTVGSRSSLKSSEPEAKPDLDRAYYSWMVKAMESDILLDAIDVGDFGAQRIVAQTHLTAQPIEQMRLRKRGGFDQIRGWRGLSIHLNLGVQSLANLPI